MNCVSYPNQTRNYCIFDENRISQRKNLALLKESLENLITVICLTCGVKHKIKSIIDNFNAGNF